MLRLCLTDPEQGKSPGTCGKGSVERGGEQRVVCFFSLPVIYIHQLICYRNKQTKTRREWEKCGNRPHQFKPSSCSSSFSSLRMADRVGSFHSVYSHFNKNVTFYYFRLKYNHEACVKIINYSWKNKQIETNILQRRKNSSLCISALDWSVVCREHQKQQSCCPF